MILKSIGHPPVDHYRLSFHESYALGQQVEHRAKRLPILDVAGEYLMGDRKAVAIDHQAHHHLFAVRTLVARVAPFGFRGPQGLAFEVRAGQVVQKDGLIQVEEVPLPLDQRPLNGHPVRMQSVEIPIQRILHQTAEVHAQNVV